MRFGRALLLGFGLFLSQTGCKRVSDLVPPPDEFETCSGDATEAEMQENLVIATEYSLGVSADLQLSWTPVLFTLDFMFLWAQTLGALPSEKPVGRTFDNGTYHYGSDAAAIELHVLLTEDSALGPAGTPVAADILDLESYLVGAVVTADQGSESVTITFDSPGPLAPLLGLGDAPTSPISLDAQAQKDALASLGKIGIQVEYIAYGVTKSTLVDYHAASPVRTISEVSQGASFPVDLVAVNASRDALDQTLTTKEWNVDRSGANVTGFTTFTVSGGHFSYVGRLDFDDAEGLVYASIDIDCP